MKSALFKARASTRVQQQLTRVRKVRDRIVDLPLKQVELARRRLLTEDVDVLLLGDSSTLFWSPKDTDRTLLPELLAKRLDANVVCVRGPGFSPGIYGEALRLLGSLDKRPRAVVAAVALRDCGGTHVLRHPVVGYPRSLAALAKVPDGSRRIRYVGRGGSVDDARAKAAYFALPMATRWSGERTVGWFRDQLGGLGPPPWPREVERLRFDYFHGEVIQPDDPGLAATTAFAQRTEEYGVPTVAYWSLPPLERGETHFPGEFETHVRANLATVQAALTAGSEKLPPLLDVDVRDEEFEDSQNATEHFSYAGRTRVVDAIADALAERA